MNSIVLQNITKWYGPLCAVRDLSLEVENEIFGLLGPNGSGKTTTIRMLTTLLEPTEGKAFVCGHEIRENPGKVREKISYVPQEMAVDAKFTGRENVRFYAKMYGVKDRENRIDDALAVMDLSDRADEPVKNFSGGMRRRLELAQALVHEPEVLFLDEPTVGLDVAARKKIWEHINSLRKNGMTVFVTTHYLEEADAACDRIAILDKGQVVAIGTPAHLKNHLIKDVIIARITGEYTPTITPGYSFKKQEGDELFFLADSGSEIIPELVADIGRQGLQLHSISLREPRLDDVFLESVSIQEEKGRFNDVKFRTMLRRTR
ncbi:ATP-binding cassette domain-containing protein [uncultured Methanospirillum sp.]|uniref:ABC transporter ATP-binding protein n=1 Tax=uncultured Methanospirillum sp. TaxID=262503 RepID=UPI0029C7500B|nr:ATP-binding cassette domain-containing protein [uncultured Methanospirillum sp.]